ncbi:probable leucine-rich repeat receptor-like protein kinase At5g49770 [Arachis hypogaea]|uniref:probable leucine-rich repeat receptor-like protein kinase At5g49770 n=1 Tax=Arachis hypogaea TaxID=3818 RepID=UPI003B20BEF5
MQACKVVVSTCAFGGRDDLYQPLGMSEASLKKFGPYYFIAFPYAFPDSNEGNSLSTSAIIGIAVGSSVLFLSLIAIAVYAILQKKRAERAIGLSRSFASWAPSGKDNGGAPQLKGARWFSYDELKKSTSHFSESNELGFGGYDKVYKGVLPDGKNRRDQASSTMINIRRPRIQD